MSERNKVEEREGVIDRKHKQENEKKKMKKREE